MDANCERSKMRDTLEADPNRSTLTVSPLLSSPSRMHKDKEVAGDTHPIGSVMTAAVPLGTDACESYDPLTGRSIVHRMRRWRHTAIRQHRYVTAQFWGDKVFSWTKNMHDAFWLAQIYFDMYQYSRAEWLLTRPFNGDGPIENENLNPGMFDPTNVLGREIGRYKGRGKETGEPPPPSRRAPPPEVAMDIPPRFRIPGGIHIPPYRAGRTYTLLKSSLACRCLAAHCQIQQGKWSEAKATLGKSNSFRGKVSVGQEIAGIDGGIKFEASMCYLRGLLNLKLNRDEFAKQSFMEALVLDVKCYEAFNRLISGEMMTADEEWEFVQSLAYKQQVPEDAEFVRLIYTSRLHKYKHAEEHALTRQRLVEEYGLKDNVDVLYSFADAAYTQYKWMDCFTLTQRILFLVDVHERSMALHIACMYHLPHLHPKLFVLAHELAEKEPEAAMSWYAVGMWYLKSKKWTVARKYFSKMSLMDPQSAEAWIAFGHTFALDGMHDIAVTAYTTCARLFRGSYLPLVFIGMEHIMLSNLGMADEKLNAADKMCDGDPLLYNERGVMAFNRRNYETAATLFQKALEISEVSQSPQDNWSATYVNLGSAYSKLGRYEEACGVYRKVLERDSRHATALALMGKTYMLMGRFDDAIQKFHESSSINPTNGYIIELLNLSLKARLDFGSNTSKPSKPSNSLASDLNRKPNIVVNGIEEEQAKNTERTEAIT